MDDFDDIDTMLDRQAEMLAAVENQGERAIQVVIGSVEETISYSLTCKNAEMFADDMLSYVIEKSGVFDIAREEIRTYGALKVFEAAAAGECGDYALLEALGLYADSIAEAAEISNAAYDQMTPAEQYVLFMDAEQDDYT